MRGDAGDHHQHHEAAQGNDAVGERELDDRFIGPPQAAHQQRLRLCDAIRQQQRAQRR